MLENRGIEGVRVLQGLVSLANRHPSDALEEACLTAFSHRAFRLRILRQLLKRQADKQKQFDFVDEHPIIRPPADYTAFVASAIKKNAGRAPLRSSGRRGLLRHGLGVRGGDAKSPDGRCHQGSGASSTRPRSGYPSSGCSSAEPDSVSPDTPKVIPLKPFFKKILP